MGQTLTFAGFFQKEIVHLFTYYLPPLSRKYQALVNCYVPGLICLDLHAAARRNLMCEASYEM